MTTTDRLTLDEIELMLSSLVAFEVRLRDDAEFYRHMASQANNDDHAESATEEMHVRRTRADAAVMLRAKLIGMRDRAQMRSIDADDFLDEEF